MSLAYLFDSNIQFQDRSGNNNVNGFLRVYIDDTDDRAVTYKDFNGTLNQADIRLDNNGRAVVIVDDSKTYRLEVYGTTGVLLWTLYPISPKATGINETLEALVAAVKSHTIAIEGLALGKKNKQQAKVISGIPTKTVKSISQNADGEFTVEFEDIAFPHKVLVDGEDSVPKHLEDAIMADEQGQLKLYVDEKEDSTPESPNKVLVIDDSVLRERIDNNAQRIENLEETIDEMDWGSVPRAYLASTLNQSPGDSVTTRTTIDVFSVTAIEGECFEFEETTTIDDVPFGYVWIEPGTYLINASVTLQWVGNPRGTFIAKVGSVMGENFDFSQEQEISRQSTKVVTIPNRMKLAVNVTYDAGTPVMGFWIQSMQVVKLAGGMSQTTVAHGLSLEGNGSVEDPLDISNHGLQEAFDYAKNKSYFATKQEIAPLATQSSLQAETARATQRENEIEALFVLPTQEAVDTWLAAHPEATTTVQDHSLTRDKLVLGTLNFVIPEMFGAAGDGITDDVGALSLALNSGFPVYLGGKIYRLSTALHIRSNKLLVMNGTLKIDSHDPQDFSGCNNIIISETENSEFKFIDVKFESTMDQTCFDDREGFVTEVPVSNIQAFTNLQTMNSLCFINCKFVDLDFPVKLNSKVNQMVLMSCSLENFLNGIYANDVDEFVVDSCHFYELPQAAPLHHGIYYQGSGKLVVRNCYMDCVNFCLHGWSDIAERDRRIECIGSFLTGSSVITNQNSSNKTIITNCNITGLIIIYACNSCLVANCSIDYRTDFAAGSHIARTPALCANSNVDFYNDMINLASSNIGSNRTLRFVNCALSLKTRGTGNGSNMFYCGTISDHITLIFNNCSIETAHSELCSLRGTNCALNITNCSVNARDFVFYYDLASKDIKTSTIYCATGHLGYPEFIPSNNNSILIES